MSSIPSSGAAGRTSRPLAGAAARLAGLLLVLARALRRRYRNGRDADWLAELPDYLLDDIGLRRGALDQLRQHGRPRDLP